MAFVVANMAVFFTETAEPSVQHFTLIQWLFAGAVNCFLRTVVFYPLVFASQADLAGSLRLRTTAAVNSAVESLHWIWAVQIFVVDSITPTVMVLTMSFLMLGITAGRYWTGNKLVGICYAAVLWLALLRAMAGENQLSLPMFGGISLCAVVIYSLSAFTMPQTRRAEERVRRTAAEDHKRALEAVREDAAATLEQRSTFFAGASHDFKQRLHALKLMTFSTTSDLPLSDRNRPALARISAEVEDLEHYLSKILDFAQIEAADLEVRITRVSLQQLMQKADLHFEAVAATLGVSLTFRPTSLCVHADPVLLQRMLENLVSNALKFTRGRVLVAARRKGQQVVLEVWDQGPGIPVASQRKIFEAFHQDPTQAAGDSRGVGLGLAVVQRLAVELKCSVSLKSVEGRGSVFRLCFSAPPLPKE